jgi:peptidoglycan/LPS O-acetylase OafA/YrhL
LVRGDSPLRLGYQPALDGLRCLAILVVIFNHAGPVLGWHLVGGMIGVDLFFVLSGFLISTLLLERSGEPLRRFYARRALRLLPALYVLVLVVTAIAAVRYHTGAQYLRADRWVLLYVSSWAIQFNFFPAPMFQHLWSLAVEEQFYLLAPLPLLWCTRRWGVRVLPALAGVVLVGFLWRAAPLWRGAPIGGLRFDPHFEGLIAGAALAVARWHGMNLRRLSAWWPLALAVFLGSATYIEITGYDADVHYGIVEPIVTAASLVLIAGAVAYAPRILTVPIVVAIGVYSYSIYLWHVPMLELAGGVHSAPATVKVALGVVAIIAAALGSYYVVERPFLRIKNHVGHRLDTTARPQEA